MQEGGDIYFGSDFKVAIRLDPVVDMNMDDYDFYAEIYCYSDRKVKVVKEDMARQNENEYRTTCNSVDIGVGCVKVDVVRFIPDSDFENGMRTDRRTFELNKRIVK